MLVHSKEWSDPQAHSCVKCISIHGHYIHQEEDDEDIEEALRKVYAGGIGMGGPQEFEDEELIDNEFENVPIAEESQAATGRCECGALKAGTPHSSWCPLYED